MGMQTDLRRIYEEYGNHLLKTCFLYLGAKSLAEDAVQDTMIKVYQNYGGFRGDASEKTWITRIAINICKDYLKSTWYKKVDFAERIEEIEVANETAKEEETYLVQQIMKLPVKYKEVILLFYYDEFSVIEISDMIGISVSTVTTRLNRGRKKLRVVLEGEKNYGD